MRNQDWTTALGTALALMLSVSAVDAQTGRTSITQMGSETDSGGAVIVDGFAPQDYGSPYYGSVPGAMFQPPFGNNHPQQLYPPQVPPSMAPWPAISPFDPANVKVTQYRNTNGLWLRDTIMQKKRWEASIEYVRTNFKKPRDTLIGSGHGRLSGSNINMFGPQGPPVFTNGQAPPLPLDSIVIGPGAFPFPGLLVGATIQYTTDSSLFPIRNLDQLDGGLDSNGVRIRFGHFDEDGTGWITNGFASSEANTLFRSGQAKVNGFPITQALLLSQTGTPQLGQGGGGGGATVLSLVYPRNGAIPLIDAIDPADSAIPFATFNGTTQKFDVLFEVAYETSSAGFDINHYTGTVYRSGAMKISTYVGGRYIYLSENMSFFGIDSGFGYDVDEDTFRPDAGSVTIAYPLMESHLNANAESHMGGAQAGFRVDLGTGKTFHVFTHTTLGLLANYEIVDVTGNNIGDPLHHPEMHNGITFNDNSFFDRKRQTHVSPLFEQSIYADISVPHILPFMRKSFLFEDASLRLGWTWTYIGQVARPGDSINWKGFPLFPSVRTERRSFTMNQLSIGLTCPF